MQAGDIVFVRGTGLISRIVRFFDGGEYSHVALAVSETEVVEANYSNRVRKVKMDYKDYEILTLDLTPREREIAKEVGESLIGIWYDYPQIIMYVVLSALGLRHRRNKWNTPNRMICSEVISIFLYEIGLAHSETELLDVTPNELYMFVRGIQNQ